MTHPQIKLVRGDPLPNALAIVGLSFRIVVIASGRDITPERSAQIERDMERIVRGLQSLEGVS